MIVVSGQWSFVHVDAQPGYIDDLLLFLFSCSAVPDILCPDLPGLS